MTTFNDLLRAEGLDPREVILLRHATAKPPTPHGLWLANRTAFDRYQSTQERRFQKICSTEHWASFVVEPDGGVLFVGLYRAAREDSRKIAWPCPLIGTKLPADANLYRLELLPHLSAFREVLRIRWGDGARAWIQYAGRRDKEILTPPGLLHAAPPAGALSLPASAPPEERPGRRMEAPDPTSPEGKEIWRLQKEPERNPALVREAKRRNRERHGGRLRCEACGFPYADPRMFDAHHKTPLRAGERDSSAEDLAILCPTCHRQAHLSPNRLIPHDVAALRAWVAAGRPDQPD
ncbi:HNH endonuclease [Neomegalonema sp.]|uniref:HNH endonuclease n=1 Tax=Neomegalonema sp. TaxID=2039713 RepID=UPI002625B948|nr:HNH endonuclease [Neomegalonema sp.]MDD2867214.1 HNH endonuclease [Neomegalonema sp.]